MRIRARRDAARPHVALVTANPVTTGGMQTFTRYLVGRLLEADWRVTLALSGIDIYRDLASGEDPHLTVHPVDWVDETFKGDRAYQRATFMDRRRWFRRVRPDVALFVQSSNTPYRASIVGARLAGVPVVTTHRTLPWPIDDVPSRKHLFGLVRGIGLHRRRLVRRTWLTAALATRVVYNSHVVRVAYEQDYRYPVHKGAVIANGIDPSRVTDARRTEDEDPPDRPIVIGYVGRLGAEKRVDLLVQAMAALQTGRPVTLHLFGEGPERDALGDLVERLGLADRVTFHGPTSDPRSAYEMIDVLVVCSDRESSSNAVIEAMASGKAVVVTRVGGLPELIEGGTCGVCVEPNDAPALTAALKQLVEGDRRRREIATRAREAAIRRHDPEKIGRQWEALLSGAARRGHRAQATGSAEGRHGTVRVAWVNAGAERS